MKKKIFCFDIDGVICNTKENKYQNSKPNKNTIKIINELYKKNKIIIFTSRYMGRNNDNIKKAKSQGYQKTFRQLKSWGLNFHKLKFGKPSFDIYVDDKSIFFKKKWHVNFKKKYLKNNDY
tara:strand:- start:164 stop:526 length:363 start_codon:yes stop_codon:yes gene_type:complete